MRRAMIVALVFVAVQVSAGTISSISPSSIVNRGEHFLTANGSGFTSGDQLVFNGPGGLFIINVNALDSVSGAVTGWVPAGVVLNAGTYTVQVRTNGVDSNGVSFVVTRPGRLPLKLHLPELLLAISKGRLGAGIKYEVTATGGDPGSTIINCEPQSGSTFPLGLSGIKCVANDGLGNDDSGTIAVNVYDGTAPVVTVPKSWEQSADADDRGATLKYEASASDDVDGAIAVSCSPASGTWIPNGRTNVLCEAVDSYLNGNAGTFSVLVVPSDIGVLQLKTPGDMRVTAEFKTGAYVNYEVVAYGSADPDPVVQCTPASGEFFPMGFTKVYCTAVDDFDQRAEAVFVVEVTDQAFMMADVNAEADGPDGADVPYELKAENWTEEIRCTPEPGSRFALGSTTVQCESRNADGEKVTGNFEVHVADTIAPHISRAEAHVATAAGANGVPVSVIVEAVDAVDLMPRCAVSDLTAETPAGFDWRVTSDLDVEIQSEARGAFRIQVTCADAAGNRSSTTIPVSIDSNLPRRTGKVQ